MTLQCFMDARRASVTRSIFMTVLSQNEYERPEILL